MFQYAYDQRKYMVWAMGHTEHISSSLTSINTCFILSKDSRYVSLTWTIGYLFCLRTIVTTRSHSEARLEIKTVEKGPTISKKSSNDYLPKQIWMIVQALSTKFFRFDLAVLTKMKTHWFVYNFFRNSVLPAKEQNYLCRRNIFAGSQSDFTYG